MNAQLSGRRILLAALSTLAAAGIAGLGPARGQDKEAPKALGTIERLDPRFDELVAKDAVVERIGEGFEWSEGPVWDRRNNCLYFSDIPRNRVMKWQPGKGVSVFLEKSGYSGAIPRGGEPGSNGLLIDNEGRLLLCQHGDRRVVRLEPDGSFRALASNYINKPFNSPNDLVLKSNGDIYFTDPPYGLVQPAARELEFNGVFRISAADGSVAVLTKEMTFPNGLAFSPDEKTLYVANSDPKKAIWMKFPVKEDGTLGEGRLFADVTSSVASKKGLPDGMKVDEKGNLFATGPGGVLVFAPDGTHLGTFATGEATANCAFGEDGSTLFITADMYLGRVRLLTKGRVP
ncbi:Gluconolactonase precursor [Aquisphaera giovannonii]|uniref:Gluconolactonase n=1 Tax=Aquisphaera giovannonii TaxID=406548 RepID=A0A5B9WB54_9BACT|nr:SMP-30/gluconolactonase/LRE family protein [Aquisphaera giovannonii]QEH37474.1 Gluconolactonase precursor [Aquisphaera giovannonii]